MNLPAVYLVTGADAAPSAGAYEVTWTHNLGTFTPFLALFELTSVSPPRWRHKPLSEAEVRFPSVNVLTLALAYTPPAQGHVGALKLAAVNPATPTPATSPSSGGGLANDFAAFMAEATQFIEGLLPTVLTFDDDDTSIVGARWSSAKSAEGELSGLLPSRDISFRVRRELLAGIALVCETTTITEGGVSYRLTRIREAQGDPALVLECKAL